MTNYWQPEKVNNYCAQIKRFAFLDIMLKTRMNIA